MEAPVAFSQDYYTCVVVELCYNVDVMNASRTKKAMGTAADLTITGVGGTVDGVQRTIQGILHIVNCVGKGLGAPKKWTKQVDKVIKRDFTTEVIYKKFESYTEGTILGPTAKAVIHEFCAVAPITLAGGLIGGLVSGAATAEVVGSTGGAVGGALTRLLRAGVRAAPSVALEGAFEIGEVAQQKENIKISQGFNQEAALERIKDSIESGDVVTLEVDLTNAELLKEYLALTSINRSPNSEYMGAKVQVLTGMDGLDIGNPNPGQVDTLGKVVKDNVTITQELPSFKDNNGTEWNVAIGIQPDPNTREQIINAIKQKTSIREQQE